MTITAEISGILLMLFASCGGTKTSNAETTDTGDTAAEAVTSGVPVFNGDSAYALVREQVEFGPRVPNSEAHRKAGDRLVSRLQSLGAEVHQQSFDVTAFDGTLLHGRNIYARFNPSVKENRILLLAHYDTRPWGDMDPDPAKRDKPIDGANDGASGVAVILEAARHFADNPKTPGIDVLFVDAEDYGTDGDDDSWALGARYFADNMDANGWTPDKAILLDMVGAKNARFPYEYFSQQAAPDLNREFRTAAANAGFADFFPETLGGAVTDDHVKLIEKGIKAIDIIEYDPRSGFNSTWHTSDDNISNIDPATLKAVGQSLLQFLYQQD